MTLNRKNWLSLILSGLILISLSCKKDTTTDDPTPEPDAPCTVSQDAIITNGQKATVTSDTSYVNGDTLYTIELQVTQGNGITVRLSASEVPAIGKYSITNNILDLKEYEYQAFAQLYINGQAYLAQSGKVEVFNNGVNLRAKACGLQVSNPVSSDYSVDFNGNLD